MEETTRIKCYRPLSLSLKGEEINAYELLEKRGIKAKKVFLVGLKALLSEEKAK